MTGGHRKVSWFFMPAGLFCLALLAGCGSKGQYQVRGKVVYADDADASVLARGLILFDPVNLEESKTSARGTIQADGSFVMGTSKEGDGVAPGTYRILVRPPPFFAHGDREKQPPHLLNERFKDFETSNLKITVDQAIDDFVITVEK